LRMNELRTAQKIAIAVLVAVVSAAGLYAYMYFDIQNTHNRIAELRVKIAEAEKSEHELRFIKGVLEDTRKERAELLTRFVPQENAVQFIEFVEDVADAEGLAAETISVTVPKPEEDVSAGDTTIEALHMEIATEGTWSNTQSYISLLESMPYKLTVDTAEIRHAGGGGDAALQWEGRIVFRVLTIQ